MLERVRGKERDDLIGAREPPVRAAVRCEARDVLAKEPNGAGVALQIAGNEIEQGCLAGAVWPDDQAPLARQHLERDIVDRRQPAECLLQPRDGEGCRHRAFPRAAFTRAMSRRTPGTTPSGMKMTMTTNTKPSSMFQRSM